MADMREKEASALIGGLLGAGAGAFADKNNRLRGALIGGGIGAVTGKAHGYLERGVHKGIGGLQKGRMARLAKNEERVHQGFTKGNAKIGERFNKTLRTLDKKLPNKLDTTLKATQKVYKPSYAKVENARRVGLKGVNDARKVVPERYDNIRAGARHGMFTTSLAAPIAAGGYGAHKVSQKVASVDVFFDDAFEKQAGGLRDAAKWAIESPIGRMTARNALPAAAGAAASHIVDSPDPSVGMGVGALGGIVAGKGARVLLKHRGTLTKALEVLRTNSPGAYRTAKPVMDSIRAGQRVPIADVKAAVKVLKAPVAKMGAGVAGAGALGGFLTQGSHQELQQYKNRRYLPPKNYTGYAKLNRIKKEASAGHWRKLPAGQKGEGRGGEETAGRTWVDPSKKGATYLQQVRRAAIPLALKQTADIPKGTIEGVISKKIVTGRAGKAAIKEGLRMGSGRYLGGATVGALTGPFFISGIKEMKSKDEKTRRKGAAKVLLSGMAYSGAKGAGEAANVLRGKEKALKGLSKSHALREVLKGGAARMLVNLPATAGMALGTAVGSKKEQGPVTTALYGAAGGAVGSGLKGLAEVPLRDLMGGKLGPNLGRRMAGKGLGRATGGALGGAVLGGLYEWIAKKMEGEKK